MRKLEFLSIVMILGLMLSMVSCMWGDISTTPTQSTQPDDTHSCKFENWVIIKEPTNTEDGLRRGTCECGEVKDEVILASHKEYYITYRNTKSVYPKETGYYSSEGLELPWLEEKGYVFLGWYTAPNGGGEFMDEIPAGSTKNYTLYAHWELESYTISYNKVPKKINSNYPTSYTMDDDLVLDNPVWSGLEFTHWSDDKGNVYFPNGDITVFPEEITGNIILTANWKVLRNIATPAPDGGELFDVLGEEEGFVYFFYEIGTIEHVVLDNINPNLYYKSEGMPLDLTLSTTVTIGEEKATSISNTISTSITKSSGYEDVESWAKTLSDSWGAEIGGSIEEQLGNDKLPVSVKLKIEAAYNENHDYSEEDGWSHSNFESTDNNETTTESISTSLSYKNEITSSITENYSISADLPSGYYAYVHAGNVRVIAVVSYEIATGQLYLNLYGRLDNMHSMVMYYENVNQLNNPTIESLEFDIPQDEIVDTVNNSYFVKYDANGGEGDMKLSMYSVNVDSQLLANSFAKTGYTFVCWNTKPDGSGVSYSDEEIINNLASARQFITLYAIWSQFEYTLNPDMSSYCLSSIGVCDDINVRIPSTFLGKPVTKIGDRAFANCSSIKSITLPNSIKSIGSGAFVGCKSLAYFHIPESVTSIGAYAFEGCTGLQGLWISPNVTSIGEGAFRECRSLIRIEFYGYKNQWLSMYKGSYWDEYTGEYTISFIDGTEMTKEEQYN